MKYVSLAVAALLALGGIALKFTGLFPAGAVPYINIAVGTVGPFAITLLPPVMSTPFSDHVEHELARIFQVAAFALGVLPAILALNHAPTAASDWCAFASAAIAAVGILLLPKAAPQQVVVGEEVTSKGPRSTGYARVTFMAALACFAAVSLGTVTGLTHAGCGPAGKQVGIDVSRCALDQVASEVAGLLPRVTNALMGTDAQWSDEIAVLEARGVELAVCAVSAVIADLSKIHGEPSPAAVVALKRGRTYLALHGVH